MLARGAGAIVRAALPLARALSEPCQYVVLAAAAVLLLVLRRGPLLTLLGKSVAGVVVTAFGGSLPR